MNREDLERAIQNAVSAFEKSSRLVVDSIDIMKTDVTHIDSNGATYIRYISVSCSEPSRPMEPIK